MVSPAQTNPIDTPISSDLTRNDRFGVIVVFMVAIGAILLGLLLKQTNTTQTWAYNSQAAGIEAAYPAGWLVDEQGDYLVRIRDPIARPFKTQYLITIVPVSGQSFVRNVLDNLTLQRSASLSAYRVLNVEEINQGGAVLTEMRFAYVESDPNPFIQRLPVVVQGRDVIILDGDRAIVVSFFAEDSVYAEEEENFERFLDSLRY